MKKEEKKLGAWDNANLLQNMKNEMIHISTDAEQRYVYRALCAAASIHMASR